MCNRFEYVKQSFADYLTDFSEIGIPLRFDPSQRPNLEDRPDIRPTNQAYLFKPVDPADLSAGVTLERMRWGLVPFFSKAINPKFLCTNARSETVATTASYREPFRRRRCLVPASAYYEWTGEKGAKVKWRFSRADGRQMMFPGLWDRWNSPDGELQSFTMLTCAPGPDAANYHDRQPVVLDREHWATWLDLEADVTPLLCGTPAGGLTIERAPPEEKRVMADA